MHAVVAGGYDGNLVDYVHAVDDLAENRITEVAAAMVEKVVVFMVDKPLCGSRVDGLGAGHGYGAAVVGQAVVGFVFDGLFGWALRHVLVKTAALDHEILNYAMENGAIVMFVVHITEKVFDADGGFFGI